MPAKSTRPLVKKTMKLFENQTEQLELFYPDAGGYSVVIRAIIDNHIKKLEDELGPTADIKVDVNL